MKYLLLVMFLFGCARSPLKPDQSPLRLIPSPNKLVLNEDLDFEGFIVALEKNIAHLESKPAQFTMDFGTRKVVAKDYVAALRGLLAHAKTVDSARDLQGYLLQNFDVMEVYGTDDWGQVFITSYFEPVLPGRRKKTGRFTQPLYTSPNDMTLVDLGEFAELLPQLKPIKDKVLEQKSRGAIVRGRLVERAGAMPKVVPYFDREQIDEKKLMARNSAKVIAYVDPIDAFFLQIQGSGVVEFRNGRRLRVGYDSQNGHPYVPIGKYLFDVIPREKMSLQTIEAHLRSLSSKEAQDILNKNPSYVFFRKLDSRGITYFGTEVESGRTIATDYRHFPKGALAILDFEAPIFEHPSDHEPRDWYPVSRLVFDQDTGGAIRGPGRVDLFWGEGPEAKQAAGVMKQSGRLVYLVPKGLQQP